MIFALEEWGDGKNRLVHWDSLHGADVVVVLEDGKAFLAELDDDYEETLVPIANLPDFLVDIYKERTSCQ